MCNINSPFGGNNVEKGHKGNKGREQELHGDCSKGKLTVNTVGMEVHKTILAIMTINRWKNKKCEQMDLTDG